jgi:hypothetical protein
VVRGKSLPTIPSTLWLILAACSSGPSTHVGGPCLANRTCDDGQVCDQTDPGGPICLDENGDLDGDGIPNGKDFCEHMAGGDHDEDLDGIGDECDACPIAKPPAQADADKDAVDSPCDPDPRTPGDKIILFNGFNASIADAKPAWKFQGGEAVVTPLAADSIEELVIPLSRATNHMAILAGYRVDSIAAGAIEAEVAVASKTMLPLGTSQVQCGAARAGSSDAIVLQTAMNESITNQNTKPVTNVFNSASQYRVAEQLDGAMANCALVADTDANSGAIQLPSDGSAPTHAILHVRGATVRFAYILVVAR